VLVSLWVVFVVVLRVFSLFLFVCLFIFLKNLNYFSSNVPWLRALYSDTDNFARFAQEAKDMGVTGIKVNTPYTFFNQQKKISATPT